MKSFENLQRALIQVILDYHTAKANPIARASRTSEGLIEEDTDDEEAKASAGEDDENTHLIGSWSKITDQLQTSPIIDRLLALPPETRSSTLEIYINEATATHETRKPLLINLKEVLLLLDQAKNMPDTIEPDAYALIYAQLADFLLNLKNNIPLSGQTKTALDGFFQSIGENIHATLAICFREQKKLSDTAPFDTTALEAQIQEQKKTISDLNQEVATLKQQNQALDAVLNMPQKASRTNSGRKKATATTMTPHPTSGIMGLINRWGNNGERLNLEKERTEQAPYSPLDHL